MFPVVWKTIQLSGTSKAHSPASVKYSGRLGFGIPQKDNDNVVEAGIWVEVEPGDIVRLDGQDDFRPVKHRRDTQLVTRRNESLGLAWTYSLVSLIHPSIQHHSESCAADFVTGESVYQRFEPFVLWKLVGDGSEVEAKFNPIVSADATSEYKES